MRIAVTGSHGLLAGALLDDIDPQSDTILPIVRFPPREDGEILWNPGQPLDRLNDFDAIVHLAGARVDRRWTPAVRREIVESRVDRTRALCEALAALPRPPRALLCASAIGFYGNRGDDTLDESAPCGAGFLAELTAAWEAACDPARAAGIRVVHLRFGIVLSPRGGALARMLPLFRLGLGGPLGDGRQILSWIHIRDAGRAMRHLLQRTDATGPFNITAPAPVSNREFARTLGRALRRPAVLPAPAFALHLVFGEMADAALLSGARVQPRRLIESGFHFQFGELAPALEALLRPS